MTKLHETLIAIQERDRKIQDLQNGLDRLPEDREAAKTKLEDDEASVAAALAATQANEIATSNLELDIQTRKDSILKLKTQQFQTKKNEEFKTMGNDIIRYGEEIITLEDKELVLMEELEELRANLAEARESLADTQSIVDADLVALDQREVNSAVQIEELSAEIVDLKTKIDDDTQSQYERIFTSKGDFAVVAIKGGICGGCHMKIPPDNVKDAKNNKDAVLCISCGRIVYVLE